MKSLDSVPVLTVTGLLYQCVHLGNEFCRHVHVNITVLGNLFDKTYAAYEKLLDNYQDPRFRLVTLSFLFYMECKLSLGNETGQRLCCWSNCSYSCSESFLCFRVVFIGFCTALYCFILYCFSFKA